MECWNYYQLLIHQSIIKILNFLYKYYLEQSEEKKEREEKRLENDIARLPRKKCGEKYDEKRLKKYVDSRRNTIKAESPPTVFPLSQRNIMDELNINFDTYWISIDNLIRQRLISSYTEVGSIPTEIDDMREDYAVSYFYGYSRVCITALGVSFVKACTITD